ncbi:hypothetical protein CAPTEDRAFT_116774, partial [Capitella teleta]
MPSACACPERCACLTLPQGTRVHCRYQLMNQVPDGFPSDTFEIDFGHNILETITANTFPTLPNLQRLLLDFCQVKQIHDFAFSHLQSLKYLRLSDNKITRISDYAFDGLNTIEELHLDLNELEQIPKGAFNGLELETLSLKGNRLFLDDTLMSVLTKVTKLDLSHNTIFFLDGDNFKHTPNLASLDISGNNIEILPDNLGQHLSNLEVLNLSSNKISSISFKAFRGMTNLRELWLNNNRIQVIPGDMEDLIQDLSMENVCTNATNFTRNVGLQALSLEGNYIKDLFPEEFAFANTLKSLILRHNLIESIPKRLGNYLEFLTILDLSGNLIAYVYPEDLEPFTRLEVLDLRSNLIQSISSEMQPFFVTLEALDLRKNPLYCNCELHWLVEWYR